MTVSKNSRAHLWRLRARQARSQKTLALCLPLLLWVSAVSSSLAGEHSSGPAAHCVNRFPLERGPLVLERPAQRWSHVEALGEEAGIWGEVGGSFEAWVYPFKLFHGLTLLFSQNDGKTFQSAGELARYQVAAPHMAQLRLVCDRFAATETLFVPRKLPGLVILLDIDTALDIEVRFRFRPSLAPMLMPAEGTPDVRWDDDRRELVILEKRRGLEMRVASPIAVSGSSLANGMAELCLKAPASGAEPAHTAILFALSWPKGPSAVSTITTLSTRLEGLFNESLQHYAALLDRAPQVVSPDSEVNDAMAWSVVSLDQLRVRNPFLGYGLVSGYSSSGEGTRPEYAWFFDEPTLSSWAFHRAGVSSHVKEAFRFLQQFQRADGKTVHEIPQSLPYQPDFLEASPYAYIHTDGPVYFLAAYGHYYRSTGDLEFIQEEWPRIVKTLNWCLSVVDPADGLIRIEPKDWGSAESSFTVWKDTQLEAMWVRALREIEYLANAVGDKSLGARCASLAGKASQSIEEKLWNEKAGAYLWGLDRKGRPLESLVPHPAIGIWMGSFRADRAERVLERMSGSDFRSDWGVRSLPLSDSGYNASAYQTGSVWPVWNAGVIVGDYRHHRPVEAFRNWLAMVHLRTLDALGPMPEVLHGRYCKRLDDGSPHQMFSEIAVQNGFHEGLLGLEVNVPAASVKLSPYLPPTWPYLEVHRIPVGNGLLGIRIERDASTYKLFLDLRFPGGATVVLEPALPAGSDVADARWDGEAIPYEVRQVSASTLACITIPRCEGKHALHISHNGGIDFFSVDSPLRLGDTSRNLRIVRAVFSDREWKMTLEGLRNKVYAVDFFTDEKPLAVVGGDGIDVCRTSAGTVRVSLKAPVTAQRITADFVRWRTVFSWRGSGEARETDN